MRPNWLSIEVGSLSASKCEAGCEVLMEGPSFGFLKVGWLVGFLTSSSTTRSYRGRAPRQSV